MNRSSRLSPRRLTLNDAVRCISTASLLTAATVRAQDTPVRPVDEVLGESFSSFLQRISASQGTTSSQLVEAAFRKVRTSGNALVTDSTIHFVYAGPGKAVFVPSDMNGWNPRMDRMTNVAGSDFFHLTKSLPREGRCEYKFVVDSAWVLDPVNPRVTVGGYGYNSEVWMPGYVPPEEIREREGTPRGSLDTLLFRSDTLGRTHPVVVYLPPGYHDSKEEYDCIWVMDGGEYLSLGLMNVVLDNSIHTKRIRPVIGVFVDPRTDPGNPETSRRMEDYSMSRRFLNSLVLELRPRLLREFRIRAAPHVIMGASLGGLCATHAATVRPDIFAGAGAQSPAYWFRDREIFDIVRQGRPESVRFYIDTGTIHDTQAESAAMRQLLDDLGCMVTYAEYPEGHNWVNWRSRIDEILECFFGMNP